MHHLRVENAEHITTSWEKCRNRLTKNEHKLVLQILDNEISSTMKNTFELNKL